MNSASTHLRPSAAEPARTAPTRAPARRPATGLLSALVALAALTGVASPAHASCPEEQLIRDAHELLGIRELPTDTYPASTKHGGDEALVRLSFEEQSDKAWVRPDFIHTVVLPATRRMQSELGLTPEQAAASTSRMLQIVNTMIEERREAFRNGEQGAPSETGTYGEARADGSRASLTEKLAEALQHTHTTRPGPGDPPAWGGIYDIIQEVWVQQSGFTMYEFTALMNTRVGAVKRMIEQLRARENAAAPNSVEREVYRQRRENLEKAKDAALEIRQRVSTYVRANFPEYIKFLDQVGSGTIMSQLRAQSTSGTGPAATTTTAHVVNGGSWTNVAVLPMGADSPLGTQGAWDGVIEWLGLDFNGARFVTNQSGRTRPDGSSGDGAVTSIVSSDTFSDDGGAEVMFDKYSDQVTDAEAGGQNSAPTAEATSGDPFNGWGSLVTRRFTGFVIEWQRQFASFVRGSKFEMRRKRPGRPAVVVLEAVRADSAPALLTREDGKPREPGTIVEYGFAAEDGKSTPLLELKDVVTSGGRVQSATEVDHDPGSRPVIPLTATGGLVVDLSQPRGTDAAVDRIARAHAEDYVLSADFRTWFGGLGPSQQAAWLSNLLEHGPRQASESTFPGGFHVYQQRLSELVNTALASSGTVSQLRAALASNTPLGATSPTRILSGIVDALATPISDGSTTSRPLDTAPAAVRAAVASLVVTATDPATLNDSRARTLALFRDESGAQDDAKIERFAAVMAGAATTVAHHNDVATALANIFQDMLEVPKDDLVAATPATPQQAIARALTERLLLQTATDGRRFIPRLLDATHGEAMTVLSRMANCLQQGAPIQGFFQELNAQPPFADWFWRRRSRTVVTGSLGTFITHRGHLYERWAAAVGDFSSYGNANAIQANAVKFDAYHETGGVVDAAASIKTTGSTDSTDTEYTTNVSTIRGNINKARATTTTAGGVIGDPAFDSVRKELLTAVPEDTLDQTDINRLQWEGFYQGSGASATQYPSPPTTQTAGGRTAAFEDRVHLIIEEFPPATGAPLTPRYRRANGVYATPQASIPAKP